MSIERIYRMIASCGNEHRCHGIGVRSATGKRGEYTPSDQKVGLPLETMTKYLFSRHTEEALLWIKYMLLELYRVMRKINELGDQRKLSRWHCGNRKPETMDELVANRGCSLHVCHGTGFLGSGFDIRRCALRYNG